MDVPAGMSALLRTQKIQKKAARAGFDFENAMQAYCKFKEEILEFESANEEAEKFDEAGDMLFALCNVLRKNGISPETALMHANDKFIKRFAYIERHAAKRLEDMTLSEMNEIWEKSKKNL